MLLGIVGGLGIDTAQRTIGAEIVYAREPEAPRVVLIETRIDWTPERIEKEINDQAQKYNRDPEYMKKVIECESMGSTTIQSYHIRKDGTREQSFGLSQIHLPDHPTVTKEQALDPSFAIEFMAKNLGKVKWYCEDMI